MNCFGGQPFFVGYTERGCGESLWRTKREEVYFVLGGVNRIVVL